ncbi:MAG: hypothetical protein ACLQPH_07010, partial [Acidimicrobiales bacterium]
RTRRCQTPVVVSPRDASIRDLREALTSMRETREQVVATEAAYATAIESIAGGTPIAVTLEAITAASTRLDVNSVLDELEQRRHRARLSMVAAGLDEGMSIGAVLRKMGLSRQLGARIAKEARSRA